LIQSADKASLGALERQFITRNGRLANQISPEMRVHSSAGFGLVELMVAMVIGLLGIVVMMQVFSVAEAQKRTTTGGDDAISSGAISLNGIQRDIQQSGWGISDVRVIGCNVSGLLSGGASIPLVPVTINPTGITGDANTDTLLVVYGNGNGAVEGDLINAQPATNIYGVNAATSFTAPQAGPPVVLADRVFAMPPPPRPPFPTPCNLSMTTITGVNRPNVTVSAGVAVMQDGRLYNLGSAPVVRAYAIINRALVVCDYVASNCATNPLPSPPPTPSPWVTIADNVVSLRAQYGRDTAAANMDAIVDVWDQNIATPATPVSNVAAKNTEACGLMRASAVRIALVARSSQPEKRLDGTLTSGQYVTPATLDWAGSDALAIAIDATAAAAVAISLPNPSGTWPTWQDFRYKVFQTIIPLRNITSLGAVTEC
jgi:type IV pilus assembly protein PilW